MDTGVALEAASSKCGMYDVFVSFRGEDTRKGFTDHLYHTLKDYRFHVFIDKKELERGETITKELEHAIKRSRVSIIVFSRRYADSRWCLQELVKIMECRQKLKQMVLPIFYDVEPTAVRNQGGSFAGAFQKHEDSIGKGLYKREEVQQWIAALTEASDIAGLDLTSVDNDGHEGMFTRKIINKITKMLEDPHIDVASNAVGIESRVQEISNHLDVGGSNDVRIIGIWGMGGIGKTEVAKAICNKFHHMFEGKSFIPDVRAEKLVDSQNKLLSDILRTAKTKASSVAEGTAEIKRRLGNLRVLLIIDDIDNAEQLDALAIKRDSFGAGSRIVITTRDKHLLETRKVDEICPVKLMNEEEAIELLSRRAFGNPSPNEGYHALSRQVVDYCGGLPLALKVLGSYLATKSTSLWESILDKLKTRPHGEVHEKLMVSYKGLMENDTKAIFLDISCFFIGMSKDYVMKILDGCNFYPGIRIKDLQERCLLTVDKEGNLAMHDLIRDMGREIVRAESPRIPGKRSRLWHHEDVKRVLKDKSGRESVEGLTLDCPESDKPSFSTEAFRQMRELRLLKLKGVKFTGQCEDLSRELRWFCWHGFPLGVIPEDFDQTNLVDVDLSHSHIEVWEDSDELLEKLKFLNLGYCNRLRQSPDFSKLPNLERLVLIHCSGLCGIHPSLVQLKNLKLLSLAYCNLSDDAISGDLRGLSSLESLHLDGNGFNRLPILSGLSKLETITLDSCTNLQQIPELPTTLKKLTAKGCTALEIMPDFSEMLNMFELHMQDCRKLNDIAGLASSLYCMTTIHLEGCTSLTDSFKQSVLKGWSVRGEGGVFLSGSDIPSWFTDVTSGDQQVCIEVPQNFGCGLRALTACIIYSSDDSHSHSGVSLSIGVANGTQHTEFIISPMNATITASEENYLWLGHLSNKKLNVKDGDRINVNAHFIGLKRAGDIPRVKKIGVNLEQEINDCKQNGCHKAGQTKNRDTIPVLREAPSKPLMQVCKNDIASAS